MHVGLNRFIYFRQRTFISWYCLYPTKSSIFFYFQFQCHRARPCWFLFSSEVQRKAGWWHSCHAWWPCLRRHGYKQLGTKILVGSATRNHFCRDKSSVTTSIIFVAIKFVSTCILLSWQKTCFVMTRVCLLRQMFCCDKIMFVMTNILLLQT